ncbi:MAG TPA: hypothetical protein PL166_05815, partial [Candidatus Contendobacter sp.]|nr:hypothetical protein [Candidatus Contendobacter sp.]
RFFPASSKNDAQKSAIDRHTHTGLAGVQPGIAIGLRICSLPSYCLHPLLVPLRLIVGEKPHPCSRKPIKRRTHEQQSCSDRINFTHQPFSGRVSSDFNRVSEQGVFDAGPLWRQPFVL